MGTFHQQRVLLKNTYEGVPKRTSTDGYNLNYEIPLSSAQNHNSENVPTPDKIHFFVYGIQPTTVGKRLNVMYTIKVKATYSNYGAMKLKIYIPVFIEAPQFEEEKQPEVERKNIFN